MLLRSVVILTSALVAVADGETIEALDRRNLVEQRTATSGKVNHSFAIDYENDRFLLDGQPFRYVSGSFHYFRAPRAYWRDRLRKIRAAGLNAVSTYVEWSLHQPGPNVWRWDDDADILEFLSIAQQEDLLVLLRPGPYICAERDWGGFPTWLLHMEPSMELRTNDSRYMRYVRTYLDVLLEKVKPYLRGQGGPIIMVQVENEYGSFGACDADYLSELRGIFERWVGNDAVLYTTDGSSDAMLRCGSIPGIYPTVDFGTKVNVANAFSVMRHFAPKGPLVNSEFYPGWLTHWREPYQRVDADDVVQTLDEMLRLGANVNIYVFFGGTNFGYTSGANGGEKDFQPQITSYDYDAPLTEAGDPTDKYFRIRDTVSKYLPLPNISAPTISSKGSYGPVLLEPIVPLFDTLGREYVVVARRLLADRPTNFEALYPAFLPFVLYETELPSSRGDPMVLAASTADRALVYVDGVLSGTLSRTDRRYEIPLEQPYAKKLQILVENQGHLNFGNAIHDLKGISNVTLDGRELNTWNVTGIRFDGLRRGSSLLRDQLGRRESPRNATGTLQNGPLFLRGTFTVSGEKPLDTFLDTTGWGKGYAFVNGNNLGRYWPLVGPQMTLYVPATYLHVGEDNELVLLELEYVPRNRKVKFQNVPDLG